MERVYHPRKDFGQFPWEKKGRQVTLLNMKGNGEEKFTWRIKVEGEKRGKGFFEEYWPLPWPLNDLFENMTKGMARQGESSGREEAQREMRKAIGLQ